MKKAGSFFITLGLLLMAAAFGLVLHNRMEANEAGRKAEIVLAELSDVMRERQESIIPAEDLSALAEADKAVPVMPTETIDGNNYESHFSPIKYIEPEELVYFVTVEGTRYAYSVVQRETVWPLEIDKMLGKEDVPWDLTLFTCNNGGESRCTVRCMRVDAK